MSQASKTGTAPSRAPAPGEMAGTEALPSRREDDWDHQLELGDDLRAERKLVWKEAVVVLLVFGVAAVRIFLA